MKAFLLRLASKFESGLATQVQALAYTMVLTTMIAFLYDMSSVALGITIGRTALSAAAQDAAKSINPGIFASSQVIVLDFAAFAQAQNVASAVSQGRVIVDSVELANTSVAPAVKVTGRVRVATPSMGALLGINGYELPLSVTASPAWGIEQEGIE